MADLISKHHLLLQNSINYTCNFTLSHNRALVLIKWVNFRQLDKDLKNAKVCLFSFQKLELVYESLQKGSYITYEIKLADMIFVYIILNDS